MRLRGITTVLLAFVLGATLSASAIIATTSPDTTTGPTTPASPKTPASPETPASPDTGPARMLYLVGDSITVGLGMAPEVRPRDAWPARARNLICGYGCTQTRVVGHTGQCLAKPACYYPQTLLETFAPEVLDARPAPTEVVVEIGVNDLAHLADAQYQAAYRELVDMGAARGILVHIGTIPPTNTNWPWHAAIQDQRLRINDWIRSEWPTTHLDFAQRLEGPDHALQPQYDSGDGIHPNAFGAMRMADATVGRGL
jgi:lysophospholipase L1-like esterase